MNRGIWVIAEQREGELLEVSLEVVSEMKRLAEKIGEELSVVLMGKLNPEMAGQLARCGAKKVYALESEIFEPYCSTIYIRQLVDLINNYQPRLVTAGATSSTRDYFPAVAARIRAGLVTNCALFKQRHDGLLELSKPVCGGRAYANMTVKGDHVIMATVKPGTFSQGIPDESAEPEIINVVPIKEPDELPIKRLGHIEADPKTVDVSEAEMILAGGRGMGGRENFERLEELAELIGAAVGGSRPAVDMEWTDFERQIGQSGKTVAPGIYLACGISGDSYHVMGMKDSKLIIAINRDGKAPFLKIADAGAVADVNEIIPEMIRVLREKITDEGREQ